MGIHSLGYIGINSDKREDWSGFASGLLGMQLVDSGGRQQAYRMDEHAQRLIISGEQSDRKSSSASLGYIGWQVTDSSSLSSLAAAVETSGISVTHGTSDLCERRYVSELVYFSDLDDNRIELFLNPTTVETPFQPGRSISGFKTGPYGMGHAVLHCNNIEKQIAFYRDVLGFSVSDFGLSPYPMYFFHTNGRHHSFALLGTGQQGFHHFMVEFDHLDDVGQGYDLALKNPQNIAYTLGRHTNDHMTSFYAVSPSGFFVESGWGGRIIDPESWQAHETFNGPSFWGHDRLQLTEVEREKFSSMRLANAEQGLRAPAIADCPWLYNALNKETNR